MSEEKDDVCWCADPSCPVRRDKAYIASLESRLSQAEAENKRLSGAWENEKSRCPQCGTGNQNVEELQARLSHLMDVVGKLKSALEPFAHWDWEAGSPCASVWWDEKAREAKLSIAEWDGIKEKK